MISSKDIATVVIGFSLGWFIADLVSDVIVAIYKRWSQ